MVTATVEERLSRIEGAYEHLATKADVSQLRPLHNFPPQSQVASIHS